MRGEILMNSHIQFYVDEIQAILMADLYEEKELSLYSIANHLIKHHHENEYKDICQAYEIVKHQLLG